MSRIHSSKFHACLGLALALLSIHAPGLWAQQLEEIVVTAQRREQSLQEVPISIEAFTAEQITRQGYRDLEALGSLMPGVIVQPQQNDTLVTIRGFGTTGNSLTLEQATPIFLDGIHFGRASQAKMAYLDVERIEVLKGPQPVFFGNNATAGAFSITSRMPTPEWEGNVDVEIGNNNSQQVTAAAGGPLTETLGIRLAGKYETTDGYLIDAIDEQKFPHQEDWAGRMILQWTPTERFQATTKLEFGSVDAGSEGKLLCLTGKSLIFGRRGPIREPASDGFNEGEPFAVWAEPPVGEGTELSHLPLPQTGADCFDTNVSRSDEGPYYDVPDYIRQTAATSGMLDIRKAAQAWMEDSSDPIAGPPDAFDSILGGETIDTMNSYLNMAYELDNGIQVAWLTGFSKYKRESSEENFDSPYYENNQIRHIDYDQWSSEMRFTSPTGGMLEWMAGFFWQDSTMDVVSGNLRATVRRGVRMNSVWEDTTTYSSFGVVTFNFLDDKASIDLGGRYSDIDKLTFAGGYGRQWVVNEEPAPGSPGGYVEITDPANHSIYLDYDPAAGLWYYPFRDNRTTPENWKGTVGADVVGLTRPFWAVQGQEFIGGRDVPGSLADGDFGSKEFDPQVVLRYRPSENHSLFARWAQSFKLGGFDTGQTTIPDNVDDFAFDDERSETFEIGSKGRLFDGRARYDVTVFQNTFRDLQLQAATGQLDDPNANVNAGKQQVQGVEFSIDYAATEQLTLSLAGALMDGKMKEFFNAPCNRTELTLPDPACDLDTGLIDRSGQQAPYTPDWSFVFSSDYRMPVFDRYELSMNLRGFLSDSYFVSSNDFDKTVSYDTHGDFNVNVGFGDAAGVWRVSGWARNILEAKQSYHPELDFSEQGFIEQNVSPGNFRTYGVKFEYNYN